MTKNETNNNYRDEKLNKIFIGTKNEKCAKLQGLKYILQRSKIKNTKLLGLNTYLNKNKIK